MNRWVPDRLEGCTKLKTRGKLKPQFKTNTNNDEITDPGFVRTAAITESDIDSDEIADENEIEEERPVYNPFIDYETVE